MNKTRLFVVGSLLASTTTIPACGDDSTGADGGSTDTDSPTTSQTGGTDTTGGPTTNDTDGGTTSGASTVTDSAGTSTSTSTSTSATTATTTGTTTDTTGAETGDTTGGLCEDYRTPDQLASEQALLAGGLTPTYLTREVAQDADMLSFWPPATDSPTHLVACIEGSREIIDGASKYNPSVQTIDLTTGEVKTVLRGMDRCDGIRTTPWGTVLATEETVDGSGYEILDPLAPAEYTITDRGMPGEAATVVDESNADATMAVVKRTALPTMAWEGLAVSPDGIIIGGDELRPGSYEDANMTLDTDGGAMFKFVPATPHMGGSIMDLDDSPLVDGTSYALQVSCVGNKQQYGQGCEIGNAAWIEVDADIARGDADAKGATGFYRPEDLHEDPDFAGVGIRFCWTNTGNSGGSNFAEVMCGVDSDPTMAMANVRSVSINRFIEGDDDFNAFDNLAFQPGSGILYVIEDSDNGDVFACLPDGDDRDIKSDGCVKMLSVYDASAEPTGFIFHPDGTKAYVIVQHSADCNMPTVDDYHTDDLLVVSGFATPSAAAIADFGGDRYADLVADVATLFGTGTPIVASATGTATHRFDNTLPANPNDHPSNGAASFGVDASAQMDLAAGLDVVYLTRYVADQADMLSFWPANSNAPTHLIACIEGADEIIDGGSKRNPSVQAIDLSNGAVTTVLRGMDRCDGVRTTPWGTVLATEETVDGSIYEILDPLDSEEYTITVRGTPGAPATIVDESSNDATTKVVKRTELPTMAWEGLEILEGGVIVGGDELRPGSYEDDFMSLDTDGGAIFKFVPTTPWLSGTINDLASSPLVAGTTYALQVSCVDSKQQYGQGCEVGNAAWISVDPDTARSDAHHGGATGYYRPEDLHVDPTFSGTGVRFCWANTGNSGAHNYAEVMCAVDSAPTMAMPGVRTVVVNRFVEGDPDFNAHDNLAFQPISGVLYVIEDSDNGDIFACLPDGDDRDIKSDGCVKILSLKDTSAEPTGFMFHPDGTKAYLVIQHTTSGPTELMWDDYDTDDLVVVTGFANPATLTPKTFGADYTQALVSNVMALFGFGTPLTASAMQP